MELVEPNDNMSDSYLSMAEESIAVLQTVRNSSNIWTAATSYYICYYSLYSLMMKLGIKCEIHSCSLEFMKRHLSEFYSPQDIEVINKAGKARTDLQYYVDRPVDARTIELVSRYCKIFFIKTKDIISRVNEEQIKRIREELQKIIQKGARNGRA
ncbi:hypothetical protein HYV83_02465 [Candidatus Woesearchaeota archaeon]|nr:hypothetical protein [Candidatus Woesearchaeota archaeon]